MNGELPARTVKQVRRVGVISTGSPLEKFVRTFHGKKAITPKQPQ